MDQLPRLGKRELVCLLLFTCNYVVSVWRGFLFLCVLGMGYVILLWHSLRLPLIILHVHILVAKVKVEFFSFTVERHIDFNFGRQQNLSTLKSDIRLSLAASVYITYSSR